MEFDPEQEPETETYSVEKMLNCEKARVEIGKFFKRVADIFSFMGFFWEIGRGESRQKSTGQIDVKIGRCGRKNWLDLV